MILDLSPYVRKKGDKRKRRNSISSGKKDGGDSDDAEEGREEEREEEGEEEHDEEHVYQLVGVVVHSGVAEAGHYYSFIKVSALFIIKMPLSLSSSTITTD
jgi:hypothetical protein